MNELDFNLLTHIATLYTFSSEKELLQIPKTLEVVNALILNIEELIKNGATIPEEFHECISLVGYDELKTMWESILKLAQPSEKTP